MIVHGPINCLVFSVKYLFCIQSHAYVHYDLPVLIFEWNVYIQLLRVQ